jgi:hypothetical protein
MALVLVQVVRVLRVVQEQQHHTHLSLMPLMVRLISEAVTVLMVPMSLSISLNNYRELQYLHLMVSMLMALTQTLITVRHLFILQTIMVVQAQPTVVLQQLMHMLPHLVIFIKMVSLIMREVILVMMEQLPIINRGMWNLVSITIMNMTLTMLITTTRTQLPMSLTLLAPVKTMLVIIITVNTGKQEIKGIRALLIEQEGLRALQGLQALQVLLEATELQELPEPPEQTVLQALTEQMGQQQLALMVSQVEVEESLS